MTDHARFPSVREHRHSYDWIDGQLIAWQVRELRALLYKWGITSRLRKRAHRMTLVYSASSKESLRFAMQMHESMVAIKYADEESLGALWESLVQDIKPPRRPIIRNQRTEHK